MEYIFEILDDECWWGGTTVDGRLCPFDKNTVLERNFLEVCSNQTMPMYLSNKGRCIWSEEAFKVKIYDGKFIIDGNNVVIEQFGSTLKEAYLGAMNKYFPPTGEFLPEEFFKAPQYNTWMHLTYNQNQKDILAYAEQIIKNDFKPGIFIIDEGWQKDYGVWEFDPAKFENPKEMVDKLHEMGFIVMLWVVPNIRPDGLTFVQQTDPRLNPEHYKDMFMRTEEGNIAISSWWNGYSAILDMTKQCDIDFLDGQLKKLVMEYNIDGFKFDGGNPGNYANHRCINGIPSITHTAGERNIAWNDFGSRYKFHEYKDTFKGGGKRVIQRIRDKSHSWDTNGLAELIPCAILQGITGHPFICPDMIGSGAWIDKATGTNVDQELFVRMAQCSTFFPMMQFSWAPWEALSEEYLNIVKESAHLHDEFADTIITLVKDAYKTGEPILRNLEYNYPNQGYERINNIFMLGEDILVAPVTQKGQTVKTIPLPKGIWKSSDGQIYEGGKEYDIEVTINSIPYFTKQDRRKS